MPITEEQKEQIINAIKNDGFMISGYCKRKGWETSLFYKTINNVRGQGVKPSPKCDAIISDLRETGYLPPAKPAERT